MKAVIGHLDKTLKEEREKYAKLLQIVEVQKKATVTYSAFLYA